jgi:hypothetical protein
MMHPQTLATPIRRFLPILLLAAVVFSPVLAQAVEIAGRNVDIELGLGGWLSQGKTQWSHDASGAGSPFANPTSKLAYKDKSTNIIDFTAKAMLAQRWFVRLNGGLGSMGNGTLTDEDFLAVDGGRPSSATNSNITGDGVQYLNADFGARIVKYPGDRGWLELFVGYQYWHEKYETTGVTQVSCTPAGSSVIIDPPSGVLCNPNQAPLFGRMAITNEATWHSVRLGAESEFRFSRRFSVDGKVAFIPVTSLTNEDIHHLRPQDFQQNPSLRMTGTGIGVNADATVRYMLSRGLFFSAGYRIWYNRVQNGTLSIFGANGDVSKFNLNEFQALRHGWTFGLNYIF